MPSGGDGFYYFSAYLLVQGGDYGFFDIQVDGDTLCTARTDEDDSSYVGQAACSAATYVSEGIEYHVMVTYIYPKFALYENVNKRKIEIPYRTGI